MPLILWSPNRGLLNKKTQGSHTLIQQHMRPYIWKHGLLCILHSNPAQGFLHVNVTDTKLAPLWVHSSLGWDTL